MTKLLNRFKLSTRIMFLGVVIILCFSIIFVWLFPKLKSNMYFEKELKTRHLVEAAYSIADHYRVQAQKGTLSDEEARKEAMAAVKDMRYEKNDYFWINDMSPKMIMHPIDANLDGKDLSTKTDPNGKRMFVEMAEVCRKNGEGFVHYAWHKTGSDKPLPKISYVKLLPEWGWIIGSGIYVDDVDKEIASIILTILGVAAVVVLISLSLSFLMAKSISTPIHRFAENLDQGAEQVASASGQVSETSQSLAEGASEQAASIEETSSSLEEMSSMTKQNADNANQADQLMTTAVEVINIANQRMVELTDSMSDISQASEETSKIIKTIDEIAFQTNLLALNAAVEAARAGEAGAGFAVVADEVRNLAMRAAEAAKNTGVLIEGSVQKIKIGSDIVTKTNDAFGEVSQSAARVGELVAEISAASTEQAQGIDQVNTAVAEMDKVVQNNAASAEESASAAEEMNAQAEQMKSMIEGLMALVDGTSTGNGGNFKDVSLYSSASLKTNKPMIRSAKEMVKKGRMALLTKNEIDPDKVIPMDEADLAAF